MYDKDFEQLFNDFGRKMTRIKKGEEKAFFGFLQPLRYKNKMYLTATTTELGYHTARKFLLISEPSVKLKADEREEVLVLASGEKYACDHSETVSIGKTECYCWSIVHKIGY